MKSLLLLLLEGCLVFTNLRVRFPPGVEETGLVLETSLDLAWLRPAELLAVTVRVQ